MSDAMYKLHAKLEETNKLLRKIGVSQEEQSRILRAIQRRIAIREVPISQVTPEVSYEDVMEALRTAAPGFEGHTTSVGEEGGEGVSRYELPGEGWLVVYRDESGDESCFYEDKLGVRTRVTVDANGQISPL